MSEVYYESIERKWMGLISWLLNSWFGYEFSRLAAARTSRFCLRMAAEP